jgi:hypothetical protein
MPVDNLLWHFPKAIKVAIAAETGNDPQTLELLKDNGHKLTEWQSSNRPTAVTVIIHPPPVTKVYRIQVQTPKKFINTFMKFSYLMQLVVPQGGDEPITLGWAMEETAEPDSTFTAHLHYSGEYDKTGFSNRSTDGHYSFTFNTNCARRAANELNCIYVPATGVWIPRRVAVDYTDKQVTSFIVYEVPAAELHQTTLKIE